MVRMFTVSFDFEGKTYLALASLQDENEKTPAYRVRLFNQALYRIVPGGNLEINGRATVAGQQLQHPLANVLVHSIQESVLAHLQAAHS
jgi:hypothetical protein